MTPCLGMGQQLSGPLIRILGINGGIGVIRIIQTFIQDGVMNWVGHRAHLQQKNKEVAVPVLLSSRGYAGMPEEHRFHIMGRPGAWHRY